MAELLGRALARDLLAQSRAESRRTPMEDVIAAASARALGDDQRFRLIARLWTLERMLYYVYGGWGQGLERGRSRRHVHAVSPLAGLRWLSVNWGVIPITNPCRIA